MERKPKTQSAKDVTFEQIEGSGKGKKVKVIVEDEKEIVLENVSDGFAYKISRRSFRIGYKKVGG